MHNVTKLNTANIQNTLPNMRLPQKSTIYQ